MVGQLGHPRLELDSQSRYSGNLSQLLDSRSNKRHIEPRSGRESVANWTVSPLDDKAGQFFGLTVHVTDRLRRLGVPPALRERV